VLGLVFHARDDDEAVQLAARICEAAQAPAEGAGHPEQASRELSQLVGRLQQLIGAFRV